MHDSCPEPGDTPDTAKPNEVTPAFPLQLSEYSSALSTMALISHVGAAIALLLAVTLAGLRPTLSSYHPIIITSYHPIILSSYHSTRLNPI